MKIFGLQVFFYEFYHFERHIIYLYTILVPKSPIYFTQIRLGVLSIIILVNFCALLGIMQFLILCYHHQRDDLGH